MSYTEFSDSVVKDLQNMRRDYKAGLRGDVQKYGPPSVPQQGITLLPFQLKQPLIGAGNATAYPLSWSGNYFSVPTIGGIPDDSKLITVAGELTDVSGLAPAGRKGWCLSSPVYNSSRDRFYPIVSIYRDRFLTGTLNSRLTPDQARAHCNVDQLPGSAIDCRNPYGQQGPSGYHVLLIFDPAGTGDLLIVTCDDGRQLTEILYDCDYLAGGWRKRLGHQWVIPDGSPDAWQTYIQGATAGSNEQRDNTTISLGADHTSRTYGQAVQLTAGVGHSAGAGDPTGTVVFFDNGLPIGSCGLGTPDSTHARITVFLRAGSHEITAIYGGDSMYNRSESSPTTITVAKCDLTCALTFSPNAPLTFGQQHTMRGTLTTTVTEPSLPGPTGNIEFYDGEDLITAVAMSGNYASATATYDRYPPAGNRDLNATYHGDANFNAANASHNYQVNKAQLTGQVVNLSRIYGDPNPTPHITWTGFQFADGVEVLSGAPAFSCSAGVSSPVGNYPVTAATGTLAAANYSFNFRRGQLLVTPAMLTITANDAAMIEGDDPPALTGTVDGIKAGDNITYSGVCSATKDSPVNTYVIHAGGHDPAGRRSNYILRLIDAVLTVNPKP